MNSEHDGSAPGSGRSAAVACSPPGGDEWEWINRRRAKLIVRDVRAKDLTPAEKSELAALEIIADLRCEHEFPNEANAEVQTRRGGD